MPSDKLTLLFLHDFYLLYIECTFCTELVIIYFFLIPVKITNALILPFVYGMPLLICNLIALPEVREGWNRREKCYAD